MAAKRRHWKEKDGRFWARLSIPAALRPLFDNKTQLTEPLGGDLRVADRNHAAAVARLQAQLDEARGRLATSQQPANTPILRSMTEHDRETIVWEHYTRTQRAIEEKRASMPTPAEIEAEFEIAMQRIEAGEANPDRGIASQINLYTDYELKAGARHFDRNLRSRRLAALRAAVPSGETRLIDATVAEYVSNNRLDISKSSQAWNELAHALIRAEIEALQRSLEFDAGNLAGTIGDPLIRPPAVQAGKARSVPLRSLFEDYIATRNAVGMHLDGGKNWRRSVERLIEYLGHDDASRITKRNLLDWRDAMLAEGVSAKTIADKHLAALRAVFRWAFENDRLPTNEMDSVNQDAPKKVHSREKGYTDHEALDVIRVSLSYEPEQRTNAANREGSHITTAKRWVPLLCAFTGARVTEITQLRKEDLREHDGRWILRITPDAGSVKTGQYRDVPLHRQVVTLGFTEFVRAASPGPLFHAARTKDKCLANARATAGRLSEWLQKLGLVPEGVAPNYGWRHRFKTIGRELGVSDRVLDAIQGHPGRTASDAYGDVTIAAKLHVIDAFPDFALEERKSAN